MKPGDYNARLPLSKIGAFAEYVAVDQSALAAMPRDMISLPLRRFHLRV